MSVGPVKVVRTGTANLASVMAGLRRAGARAETTDDAEAIASATRVVLPGVGAFGPAIERLRERGLVEPLIERIRLNRPTLAVCLGLQLLAEASDESPGVAGLGVFSGVVTRFDGAVRVPQLGWNRVEPEPACTMIAPGWAYFANSYRLVEKPAGWAAATTDYGGAFVAALERGNVLACQFHPELSGAWGLELLRRWLARSESPAAARMESRGC